jgi:hypothetical protein
MKAPNVCTATTTHRRIVSLSPKALGASTSSRRMRREENHLIFAVRTKYHLCAETRYGSKMFTRYPFSRIRSAVLFCGSGKILASGKAENARLYPRGSSSLSTTPHQAKRFPQTPAQVLDLILISLIYSLTAVSSFYSVLGISAGSNFRIRIPHLNSQREHLILGTIIEAGSGSQSAFRNRLCAHQTLDYRRLLEIIGLKFRSTLIMKSLVPLPWPVPLAQRRRVRANFLELHALQKSFWPPSTCTKFTNLHKITQSLSSYVQHLNC